MLPAPPIRTATLVSFEGRVDSNGPNGPEFDHFAFEVTDRHPSGRRLNVVFAATNIVAGASGREAFEGARVPIALSIFRVGTSNPIIYGQSVVNQSLPPGEYLVKVEFRPDSTGRTAYRLNGIVY